MAEENNTPTAAPEQTAQGAQFSVQRIYTRDISFETPNSPAYQVILWWMRPRESSF
jgi:preprotein translocase subunit SecB